MTHLLGFRKAPVVSTPQSLGAQTPKHHQISGISSQNGCEKTEEEPSFQ
jgi:hypothetical protein